MDMSGEYRIPAPRQRVWEALNDPAVLKASIPGCESLDKVSDTELTAKVRAKVGPVSAAFAGKVTLGDLNPPESYTISGEGSGGVAGFAKGGAKVDLTEEGAAATLLRYSAKADVGGKLAQIGSRLVQGTAKKMADEFFSKFSKIVGDAEAAGPTAAAAAPSPGPKPAPTPPKPAPVVPAAPLQPAAAPPPRREAPRPEAVAATSATTETVRAAPEPMAPPPATRRDEPPAPGLMQSKWVWVVAAVVVLIVLWQLFGGSATPPAPSP